MTTTTPATTSTTTSGASILNTLGVGSGIDTTALVDNLTNAIKVPKEAAITARQTANTAKISGLADAASGIDTFTSALNTLISGGTLFTQPTSTDSSVVSVAALPGSRIDGLSSTIEVRQLAQAQTLVSGNLANAATPVGQGSFTLTLGTISKQIVVDGTNNSLAGLAKAINDASTGITASIVTDTQGSRLVMKGATGAAQIYTLTANADADADLQRFAYDGTAGSGLSVAQAAQDALVRLDGVDVARSSNSFSDLIPGVQITLAKAVPGTTVSIGAQRPTDAIKQAVNDFVSAYNTLKAQLDAATAPKNADGTGGGALRGDPGIRDMQTRLSKLTLAVLSSTGDGPHTLAEIGVATQRDGTLAVNADQLDAALAANPQGVEALFNPSQSTSTPLLSISSVMGKVKPGTYAVTNIVAGPPPSGMINGVAAIASGTMLIAAANSGVAGLILQPFGDVASATITIDPGLGGALQAIRDALRSAAGSITTSQTSAAAETKQIASDSDKVEAQITAYHDRLVLQFTTMDTQVAAFKATQSYLTQQVAMWTKSNN